MKTDAYIKDIVVAAIRRKGANIDEWLETRLWDQGDSDLKARLMLSCQLESEELPILYSYVDAKNWTLVTTRRIWCAADDRIRFVAASDVTRAGIFKGLGQPASRRMQLPPRSGEMLLSSRSGENYYCPYNTGPQSIVTLYAVTTLVRVANS